MIRLSQNKNTKANKVIPMSEMKPLQVGRVINSCYPNYNGKIVMRTSSTLEFEVIDLSNPRMDGCWSRPYYIMVELLGPGEVLTVELFNE